jgi:hypothetical protein
MLLLKRFGLIALVLVFGLFGLGWWSASHFLSKEQVISQIEAATSAKVSIESMQSSLLSFPASVTLTNVSLLPRDPTATKTSLRIDLVTLKLSLTDLIFGKTHIDQLLISGVNIRDEISKEGVSPLARMFEKTKSEAAPVVAEVKDPGTPAAPPQEIVPIEENAPPQITAVGLSAGRQKSETVRVVCERFLPRNPNRAGAVCLTCAPREYATI